MAIPTIDTYQTGVYLRPNDDIDPKLKSENPRFSLEWSKYIFSQYQTGNGAIKPEMIERFKLDRLYAEGNQPAQIYKDWIFGSSKGEGPMIPVVDQETERLVGDLKAENIAEKNINFDNIFSPLPKYVSNTIGIMQSQNHDIVVDAEDENSGVLREEMKFEAWIREELGPALEQFNIAMNTPDATPLTVKPKSLEELELFENIGAFKLPYETGMEKALSHTSFISGFDKLIKDNIIADFFIIGYSAVMTYIDVDSGKIKYKWLDVENLILEDSLKNDYSDSSWGGYIEYYTINQLRTETGLKENELYQLAANYRGQFGNIQNVSDVVLPTGRYNYDDCHIPVLQSYFRSVDSEYYTKRKTKSGNEVSFREPYRKTRKGKPIPPKVYDKENMKTSQTDIRRLYSAKWIINTEFVFDYGIATNTPYNYGTNDVEFPISLYKVKGPSKIESMRSIADQIQLTYLKTQSAIAKAAPPGLAIDMNSLDNITWGNKKLKPRDTIKIYTVSGNMFYRLTPKGLPGLSNSTSLPTPIRELTGGMGKAIADNISAMEFLYRQLDMLTGIDGITSSNTQPSRDTGKTVTQLAVAATSNTLRPIYSGFINLKERSARCAGWTFVANLDAYDDVKDSPYYRILGSGTLLAIKAASNFPPAVYGFRIEAKITDEVKAAMMQAAQEGMLGGKNGIPALTYSEYSFIVRHLNSDKSVKYIEMYMAKKEQERAQAERQASAQATQDQANVVAQQTQQKSELQAEQINLEKDKELAIEREKGEQARLTQKEKYDREEALVDKQIASKIYASPQPQNAE